MCSLPEITPVRCLTSIRHGIYQGRLLIQGLALTLCIVQSVKTKIEERAAPDERLPYPSRVPVS